MNPSGNGSIDLWPPFQRKSERDGERKREGEKESGAEREAA